MDGIRMYNSDMFFDICLEAGAVNMLRVCTDCGKMRSQVSLANRNIGLWPNTESEPRV